MGWLAPRPGRFTPRERDPVRIVQEAGWAPGPVWTDAEYLTPPGFDPRTVQPVASRYTDYASGMKWTVENLYGILVRKPKRKTT
jgi:hypothetical protein